MRKYLTALFPSLAALIGMLALPILVTTYYVITGYSSQYANDANIDYVDIQGSFLGNMLLEQRWVDWFNRFMDFAFWGMLAAIVLVIIWLVSSAKTATKNHYAQESFTNFQTPTSSWHTHFFVVAVLKVIMILIFLYTLLAILGQSIPHIQTAVLQAQKTPGSEAVWSVVLTCLGMVSYQYLAVTSLKIFKHLRAD